MEQKQAKEYWEKRLSGNYSLGGVGYEGIGKAYNKWIYKLRKVHFRKALKSTGLPTTGNCLDIGSGTGFFLTLLRQAGFSNISGSDFTQTAVDAIRKNSGIHTFHLDITQEDIHHGATYSLVTCMDVLFHVLEKSAYEQAFKNLASLMKKDGYLLFTENRTPSRVQREHIYDRSEADIRKAIADSGLVLIQHWSQFIFLNPPVESRNKFLRKLSAYRVSLLRYFKSRRLEFVSEILGCALYLTDRVLLFCGIKGKGTSLFICRKLSETAAEGKTSTMGKEEI